MRHGLFYARQSKPAVRAALPEGLHGLRFHDLRHTCTTLSMESYSHLFSSAEQALCAGLDAAYEASVRPAENLRRLNEART